MTEQDFEFLAMIIRDLSGFTNDQKRDIAYQFCDHLAWGQPKFDRFRFADIAMNVTKPV